MLRRAAAEDLDRYRAVLAAAQRLSYQQGVNVGVDALLSAANVARRSL